MAFTLQACGFATLAPQDAKHVPVRHPAYVVIQDTNYLEGSVQMQLVLLAHTPKLLQYLLVRHQAKYNARPVQVDVRLVLFLGQA